MDFIKQYIINFEPSYLTFRYSWLHSIYRLGQFLFGENELQYGL